MSMCMRPRVTPIHLAGREVRRCENCLWVSPPFEQDDYEAAHRGVAVAANAEIDREAS